MQNKFFYCILIADMLWCITMLIASISFHNIIAVIGWMSLVLFIVTVFYYLIKEL